MLVIFFIVYLLPVGISAGLYFLRGQHADWWSADRSSAGLLPAAREHPAAVMRVFSARTVSWRGIVATHSWIVIKESGARSYQRFDYTAWGQPISVDRFAPDARWFGSLPETVYAADGAAAEPMIPRIRTAIGKDFPYAGHWVGLTPSKTGVRISMQGYVGLTLGWVEGLELNLFGAVAGIDLRRPAIKLPGLGRIGFR